MEIINYKNEYFRIEHLKNGNLKLVKVNINYLKRVPTLRDCSDDELLNEFVDRPKRNELVCG